MCTDATLKVPAHGPAGEVETSPCTADSGLPVLYGGEALVLLPARAVCWPAQRTIFIADTHFGKEATFRAASIPVPDQTTALLQRISSIISATSAARLIILGDLIHARRGRCSATFRLIAEWRQANRNALEVLLVRGNHDLAAGDPPLDWHIRCVSDPESLGPFALTHIPPASAAPLENPVLAGHLHPVVRLSGPGRDSLRLPCFLLRPHVLVLPAFSDFVDGKVTQIESEDRVFAVADQQVLEVPLRPSGARQPRVRR